jgi:endogenous inhibitor of DNA gyrase (YacG/DUF329 family)
MTSLKRKADGQKGCPICGAAVVPAHQPFCSRHCADVDLSRWFRGRYAIPSAAADDDLSQIEGVPGTAEQTDSGRIRRNGQE